MMDTRYNPENVEPRWHAAWETARSFEPADSGEPFSMVIPPPNVTGALHLGHALNNTIQDVLVRWRRMQGRATLWIPGIDHAGIATQAVVEKRLFENEKLTRHDIGREALVERIWEWKEEYGNRILQQLRGMGVSCDWTRTRFTLDPICAKAVRYSFFNLFQKGLIFRGKRLVNWDTHLQTAVADDEIYYEEVKGKMWTFKYYLADGSGHLPVATTRPETVLGDTAVAVHPEDPRYKHLIGKMCRVPFVDREIPIIADGLLVDPEFGTGVVKVTPGHDPNDYATGLRHKLPIINIMDSKGVINEEGGPFEGLDRLEARQRVVEEWEEQGSLIEVKEHIHQVGHSDRSKTPIEPWMSDQWFVKMDELAERAMEAVRSGEVRIIPERYSRSYLDWLGEKRDWCISRQLWWGHRIPIWRCEGVSEGELKKYFNGRDDLLWRRAEDEAWLLCSRDEDLAEDAIPGHRLVQDPDVLDTWFSSALWPHSTMGWPDQTEELRRFYPTSLLVTSRDIITLWVARMVIFSQENMGTIPFHEVFIHPKILDGKGQTMSKSRGNGVDPLDIIEKYGSDALRFVMAQMCTENQDARMPVKPEKLDDGRTINTSEKFEIGRNFANKLWNAVRFLHPHIEGKKLPAPDPALYTLEDRWILSRIHTTTQRVDDALSNYRLSEATQLLYHFAWDDLCSRYLEIKKGVLTDESENPQKTNSLALFMDVMKKLLSILHPIMPFITEELHSILFPEAGLLVTGQWPKVDEASIDQKIEEDFEQVFALVEAVRSIRGQYNIAPQQPIQATALLDSEEMVQAASANAQLIQSLAGLSHFTAQCGGDAPKFSGCSIVRGGEVLVPLEGIVDREKEIAKLRKELEKAEGFAQSIERKLSNEKFVAGAPPQVVELERQKLANQREIVEKAKAALSEWE